MLDPDESSALPLLYTGQSPFLKANRWYVHALWTASQQCRIESTEDILDARGNKLWASNQPIVPELMLKLADRELKKPIELCIRARNPVSEAAIEARLMEVCEQNPALKYFLQPHFGALHEALSAWEPNPQQLLSLSVLHHGGVDHLPHAVAVAGFAFALADQTRADVRRKHRLLVAGLLHDVGLLYYDPESSTDPETELQHPVVGALSAAEVTHCEPEVSQLILNSHERINGLGFPRRVAAGGIPKDARILMFAEAMVPHLTTPGRDIWRASVSARLVSGEFDPALVSWLVSHAKKFATTLTKQLGEFVPKIDIGAALRDLHGDMARALTLLSLPMGEDPAVIDAARHWQAQLGALMTSLRSTGVEEALACGANLAPQSDGEAIELYAIWQDLLERLAILRRWLQQAVQDSQDFEKSLLVRGTLRILQSLSGNEKGK